MKPFGRIIKDARGFDGMLAHARARMEVHSLRERGVIIVTVFVDSVHLCNFIWIKKEAGERVGLQRACARDRGHAWAKNDLFYPKKNEGDRPPQTILKRSAIWLLESNENKSRETNKNNNPGA